MRTITIQMINDFKLKKLKYDFAGYTFDKTNQLSFHHLIVPKRECKVQNIPSDGYLYWNGAILRQNTSHDYLHTIENYDYDRFLAITIELIDENILGELSIENLRRIRDILISFEREYSNKRSKNGNLIIKESYVRDRIKL